LEFRQVEKHLPHNKSASYLYEVTMTERLFKSKKWLDFLRPTDGASKIGDAIETMYESATPLLTRILSHLGNIAKIDQRSKRAIATKSYMLTDLAKVDRPSEGEYLHHNMTYKRLFLYVRINQKTRTGLVALFIMKSGSGSVKEEIHPVDLTRPSEAERGSFGVDASCHLWIIKPNARNAQRNVSLKQVDTMFAQLLETIQEAVGVDSEYACVSQKSVVDASGLKFVDTETLAYAGANEIINNVSKTGPGATVILLNSSRPTNHLRRYMSTFSSHPVLSAAFPPGPAHDPKLNTLPSLNWEQPAAQLSFEAYLFMTVISFPKRVAYCRYGHVPLGNLGEDEKSVVYDVSLARLLQKNRALSWANQTPGRPDVGVSFMSLSEECVVTSFDSSHTHFSQDEIWGDDDELVSPVIRRPGCYRSICVDIDIQDLAIAAMTEVSSAVAPASSAPSGNIDLNSPTSVSLFDPLLNSSKASGPLGDEMSTVISLPIVRALVAGWLKDAFTTNSLVADELLHHIYRLLSNPETLFHDPALYRIVHSLMKSTFFRLLGELRRLGCSIAYASFQRVVLVTNKLNLSDAEEYINFVLDTARRQTKNCEHGDALTKISLRPRQFHSNLVFLDEYNFGTMQLERINKDEVDESIDFKIPDPDHTESVIVAQVVTAWSVMNYLGSEIAQEYFRAIIGRFSKDVLRKQMTLATQDDVLPIAGALGITELVVQYKKKMISTHFAHYLTRAVGEIMKDGPSDDMFPPVYLHKSRRINPALEFIKNVIAVLELDSDVEQEVHVLKRSMLAQVGVAEYNKAAHWVNPCPTFVLPDVFCAECCESRDVNLCYVPPRLADEEFEKHWACVDCGTTYNVNGIEKRLLHLVHKKMVRYVLQDVRCAKTNRVATRALSPLSECSAGLKLDIQPNDAENEMRLLQSLAEFHELDTLKETVSGLLSNNRQMP
jgi:DNA polymerase epsilon subunit 1